MRLAQKFGWPMGGAAEAIVFDRGDKYITDDAYDILADLGITNLGAPAGKPWLKPYIERVFRTVHSDLLLRFSGRAFSNVVERGENDAGARATLTLEACLKLRCRAAASKAVSVVRGGRL